MEGLTERQQGLINAVEIAIDYGMDIPLEALEEYHRLTGSRCAYLDDVARYRSYLEKYARKHGITPAEANRHRLCRLQAKECGIAERDINNMYSEEAGT